MDADLCKTQSQRSEPPNKGGRKLAIHQAEAEGERRMSLWKASRPTPCGAT